MNVRANSFSAVWQFRVDGGFFSHALNLKEDVFPDVGSHTKTAVMKLTTCLSEKGCAAVHRSVSHGEAWTFARSSLAAPDGISRKWGVEQNSSGTCKRKLHTQNHFRITLSRTLFSVHLQNPLIAQPLNKLPYQICILSVRGYLSPPHIFSVTTPSTWQFKGQEEYFNED